VTGGWTPPAATDRLVVGYALLVTLLLAAAGAGSGLPRAALAAQHLGLAAAVVALARCDRGDAESAVGWLRRWAPLVALPWLYGAAGRMRHLLVEGDLDDWIAAWDAALFPGAWYRVGARLPDVALELAHAAYASYYLLLFVPALAARRRRPREVERYLYAVTATLLAHYALNLVLPVDGPHARAAFAGRGFVFVPAMDAVYRAFDRGGLAFPSTHVAAALVAAWHAGRHLFPGRLAPYALWFALVALSTVACGYHYPIDVPAGVVTGALALALTRPRGAPTPPRGGGS
jgi:membrane-associated phospholipid phosphatase